MSGDRSGFPYGRKRSSQKSRKPLRDHVVKINARRAPRGPRAGKSGGGEDLVAVHGWRGPAATGGRENKLPFALRRAQNERLSTWNTNYAIPFALRFSKHEGKRLFKSNIPRCLRRAQLNGVSKGGEHPLWSRAGLIPRARNAWFIVLYRQCKTVTPAQGPIPMDDCLCVSRRSPDA
jgi:hypothetical protein